MGFFQSLKQKFSGPNYDEMEHEENYLELEPHGEDKGKIIVRTYVLNEFDDVKPVLDALREGYTIAIVNMQPLKEKDVVELKRAVNKLKKTTDAIEGEIKGFDENYIVIAPSFATIYRSSQVKEVKEESE